MTVGTLCGTSIRIIKGITNAIRGRELNGIIRRARFDYLNVLERDLGTINRRAEIVCSDTEVNWQQDPPPRWVRAQIDSLQDITEAQRELQGYLEQFQTIVSSINDNPTELGEYLGLPNQREEELRVLEGQIDVSYRSINMAFDCLTDIRSRRPSDPEVPIFAPLPRRECTMLRPLSEIQQVSPPPSPPLSPQDQLEPARLSRDTPPTPPPTPIQQPTRLLEPGSCQSLKLTTNLPRSHQKFKFLRISPSGNYVSLLSENRYAIVELNLGASSTVKPVPIRPEHSPPGDFTCAAINDECLIIGTCRPGFFSLYHSNKNLSKNLSKYPLKIAKKLLSLNFHIRERSISPGQK